MRLHERVTTLYDDLKQASVFTGRVVLTKGTIVIKAGYPPEDILDEADVAAAKWAWQNNRTAGRGSDTLPGAKRLFLPMQTGRGAIADSASATRQIQVRSELRRDRSTRTAWHLIATAIKEAAEARLENVSFATCEPP